MNHSAKQDLVKKPRTTLGLIDPIFEKAGGGHIAVTVADLMGGAQVTREFLVVRQENRQHFQCGKRRFISILQALVTGDVADGTQGRSSKFAGTLRQGIGHGKKLAAVFIKQQMIVAKMAAGHVPVVGDVFTFMLANEISGGFSSFLFPTTPGGVPFELLIGSNFAAVGFGVTPVPLPGSGMLLVTALGTLLRRRRSGERAGD